MGGLDGGVHAMGGSGISGIMGFTTEGGNGRGWKVAVVVG
jgi:hypothetical protein